MLIRSLFAMVTAILGLSSCASQSPTFSTLGAAFEFTDQKVRDYDLKGLLDVLENRLDPDYRDQMEERRLRAFCILHAASTYGVKMRWSVDPRNSQESGGVNPVILKKDGVRFVFGAVGPPIGDRGVRSLYMEKQGLVVISWRKDGLRIRLEDLLALDAGIVFPSKE